MRSTCYVLSFNFFLGVVSEIEFQSFSIFPTWLPHHVTDDVTIIIKTFYESMSSRTSGETFISIWQAVAEKNTKVLCGQTNRSKCNTSPLARVIRDINSFRIDRCMIIFFSTKVLPNKLFQTIICSRSSYICLKNQATSLHYIKEVQKLIPFFFFFT